MSKVLCSYSGIWRKKIFTPSPDSNLSEFQNQFSFLVSTNSWIYNEICNNLMWYVSNKSRRQNLPMSSFLISLALRAASSCCSKELDPNLEILLSLETPFVWDGFWSNPLPLISIWGVCNLKKNVPPGHKIWNHIHTHHKTLHSSNDLNAYIKWRNSYLYSQAGEQPYKPLVLLVRKKELPATYESWLIWQYRLNMWEGLWIRSSYNTLLGKGKEL